MTKILIVDDSETDYKIIRSILRKSGENYFFYHNKDGIDIVELIENNDIDLIILDLVIDDVDGIEVLKEIKMNKSMKDVPIIICSSIGDKETIKKTLTMGAYDYFEKPLNDEDLEFGLRLKVKNALELKRQLDHVNYLKNHDELTGLWTRKYFELELQDLIERKVLPIGVVMLAVDGLKVLNDAYGHDHGDQLLKDIGEALSQLKKSSFCSARWGSDEMVLLLPKANKRQIDKLINQIEQQLNQNIKNPNNITFGWAIENKKLSKAKYLVQRAEDKLYSNKILESSSSRYNLVETILKTLHQKNPREEMHSHRVSFLSEQIALKLGFSKYEIKSVKMAGLLHDIGKISIDENILNKPGKLTNKEWELIKKHPEHGFKILSTSVDTLEIAKAILAHHERWDGTGYPRGLSQSDIPIMARIIMVADTYDAITSVRSYKPSISEKEALDEIRRCSGTQFDPIVVEAFEAYYKETKDKKISGEKHQQIKNYCLR